MTLPAWLPGAPDESFLRRLILAVGDDVDLLVGDEIAGNEPPRVLVAGLPTELQLDASDALERVIIPYAGVPARTRTLLRERPHLALHNLHHNAAPTAELAVALMLAALKRIVPYDRDLRRGDWRRRYADPIASTLEERRVLVLGYGAIGSRVARACLALGMAVSAIRRAIPTSWEGGEVDLHAREDFDRLLPQTDVLVCCLPLTHETRGIVGRAQLAALRTGACLVNVGRGELVDQEALYDALREGPLDCAGLDVWYRYPRDERARSETKPSHFPFGELENVVLSPHRAGLTKENEAQRAHGLADLLNAMAAGEEVANEVDVERGY